MSTQWAWCLKWFITLCLTWRYPRIMLAWQGNVSQRAIWRRKRVSQRVSGLRDRASLGAVSWHFTPSAEKRRGKQGCPLTCLFFLIFSVSNIQISWDDALIFLCMLSRTNLYKCNKHKTNKIICILPII